MSLSGLKIEWNHHNDCAMNKEILHFWSLLMLCTVQKVKWNQHRKQITATSMKDKPKHCSFCVLSKDYKTFSDLLNACKQQLDSSGYLFCYCISDHIGICRYCWTRATKSRWRVYKKLCARLNSNLAGIVKTCIATICRESNDSHWQMLAKSCKWHLHSVCSK